MVGSSFELTHCSIRDLFAQQDYENHTNSLKKKNNNNTTTTTATTTATALLNEENKSSREDNDGGRYQPHTYHDRANDNEHNRTTLAMTMKIASRGAVPFPEKLHTMLSEAEEKGFSNIVGWQPHGRCFVVREQELFVKEIMPQYFRQTKMTSFHRQLNLYDFNRISRGPDRNGYYHEFFLRWRPLLLQHIQRVRVKTTNYASTTRKGGAGIPKANDDPSREPDFYKMPFIYSTTSTKRPSAAMAATAVEKGTTAEISTSSTKGKTKTSTSTSTSRSARIVLQEQTSCCRRPSYSSDHDCVFSPPQVASSSSSNNIIDQILVRCSATGEKGDKNTFSTTNATSSHPGASSSCCSHAKGVAEIKKKQALPIKASFTSSSSMSPLEEEKFEQDQEEGGLCSLSTFLQWDGFSQLFRNEEETTTVNEIDLQLKTIINNMDIELPPSVILPY